MSPARPVRNRRDGIALVIVLGFLAVLTLMAISFVISMRTERLASTAYVDSARSKNLLDIAVARTLGWVDQDLVNNNLNAPDYTYAVPTDLAYLGYTPLPDTISLWDADTRPYLPRLAGSGAPPVSNFIEINDPTGLAGGPPGRFAFLVMNLTGLLDPNEVGAAAARGNGNQPGEIRVTPDVAPVSSASAWTTFTERLSDTWRRIETMAEFDAIDAGALSGLSSRNTFSLFGASRVERNPNGDPKIVLTNLSEVTAAETEIKAALTDCGIDTADVDDVYEHLVDFLDEDYASAAGPGGFTSEPVPMLNEVIATNYLIKVGQVDDPAFSLGHEIQVLFEVVNPFTEDYTARLDLSGLTLNAQFQPAAFNPPAGMALIAGESYNGADIPLPAGAYRVVTNVYRGGVPNVPTNFITDTVNIRAILGGPIEVELGQANYDVVDEVDTGSAQMRFILRIDGIIAQPPGTPFGDNGGDSFRAFAVEDPRMNHEASRWQADQPTLMAENNNALQAAVNAGEGSSSDGLPALFVRNDVFNEDAPGEIAQLGFLSSTRSRPWETIALYDIGTAGRALNPVLDYFSVLPSDTYRSGTISLNGQVEEALTAVFLEAPLEDWPGSVLDDNDLGAARTLAQAVADYRTANGGAINDLSELGLINALWDNSRNPRDTDDVRESNIRNNLGLLTTRQNLFGIVVEAQTLGLAPPHDPGNRPVTGSERALLVVWRDPVPNADGVHPMRVRYFTWIR